MKAIDWVALIAFMFTIITWVFPNADIAFKIGISLVAASVGVALAVISRRREKGVPLFGSTEPSEVVSGTNHALDHVGAYLFFPWYYWHIPLSWYFKRDLNHLHGIGKLVVNRETRKAFYMGDYAQQLMVSGRIDWLSKHPPPEDWVASQNLNLERREALETDLEHVESCKRLEDANRTQTGLPHFNIKPSTGGSATDCNCWCHSAWPR